MKGWARARPVQAALAWTLSTYLGLTLRTLRWRVEGRETVEAAWDAGGGVIVAFWHGRIALSPVLWPRSAVRAGRAQPPRALISLSPDGAFIALAMARLGFPAIRGSSAKARDRAKPKGGAGAVRAALAWLAEGGGLAATPDGPRGPAERMAPGVVALARRSGAPVLLAGLACRPAIRLGSWDAAMLPLPFGRGAVAWEGPFVAEPDTTPEDAARAWEARLSAATRRAEALLG